MQASVATDIENIYILKFLVGQYWDKLIKYRDKQSEQLYPFCSIAHYKAGKHDFFIRRKKTLIIINRKA